ncbi:MAG: DUF2345 domain-containing protein, partial [Burkholderiaceae bacterium]|nr:DUF2345 domain-containing protein [Burkholderiaceae bacterium]
DHPIVTGVVYNGEQLPPWALPGQRALSGWRSREIGGARGNQLVMDDTTSEISAQLASDHGGSALNLGYLTGSRKGGKGVPRGEGAELRSDMAVAVQGSQGVLINAGDGGNRQLARDGLVNAANALQGLTAELDSMAKQHEEESAEGEALRALVSKAEKWDVGTNVSQQGTAGAQGGGAPIVAANGAAGAIVTSADSVLIGSQTRVDVASVGDVQASAGRSLFLRATRTLQIFAAKLGIKLIAGSGNIQIAAHDGEVVITALKRIRLVSNERVVLEAPMLQFIAQGARSDYGDGKITHQGSGTYTVKHSEFLYMGAGDGTPEELKLPSAKTRHDQQVQIKDMISQQPLAERRYRITVEDGGVFEGTTDENGMTQRFTTEVAFAQYKIELLDDGDM